ncbi:MAG: ribonucleoside triphosphate reductase [Syntrophomonadaceae bacterium]
MSISKIKKRDGRVVPFEKEKIINAIFQAAKAVGGRDLQIAQTLADKVVELAEYQSLDDYDILSVEEIQDLVEKVLVKNGHYKTAKAYILYRKQHEILRDARSLLENNEIVKKYLDRSDWRVKENSNMNFSLQGMNFHISSIVTSQYWLNQIYTPQMKTAQESGEFHMHDLGILAVYCVGWDLQDLIREGFKGTRGKVASKPAKHFRTILGQIVNFFYTLQGEAAGAQAFSNFDTLLAPFIYYDKLSYEQVKQSLQEFIFNVNVPTRVGFQCMSEDTEILGREGWKRYDQVQVGDYIATFNVEKGFIEYLPVKNLFSREYEGIMYNLKNRISDQLISPEHRVVRKKFGGENYVLEKIEDVLKLKSPFMVPVGSAGNVGGQSDMEEDMIRFMAWLIAEGSLDSSGRGDGRICIYQSPSKSPASYDEIIDIISSLGLEYSERSQQGLGDECRVLRFNADSSRKIMDLMGTDKQKGIKFIPAAILAADVESSRIFLETYIKADGYDNCKIVTTSEVIRDQLLQVIVNAGYGATVLLRKPDNELSKKDRCIIRVIRHKDTYINKVEQVDYKGIIWCPNTGNETVVARRNGKVFITGNTPFTNITMDLKVPNMFKDQAAIIGGQLMDKNYGDFQKEMDMLNQAFAEVMMEGDAEERVFTFPIPTYNITRDFDWNNSAYERIWEMTAKYGIPGFANYINSDMDPEDARSMCCRLRLDNRELRRRGGGLFGSNPLTGSIGVVTINLPRIGYLAQNETDYFEKLSCIMDLAKDSLEIKRKVLENLTDSGLYPYSHFYLRNVKEASGKYWVNHFSTIGLVGMNESCLNFLGQDIASPAGHAFALKVLQFMRDLIAAYQDETGNLYNLEATPAEGVSYSLPQKDRARYPDIIVANNDAIKNGAEPYYTNSTFLPVGYTDDLWEAMRLEDPLQSLYTGGTTFHIFLGEALPDVEAVKNLIKKACEQFHMPYYYISPTFSICPQHGYIRGEHFECPYCRDNGQKTLCEVYSRVVGYLRPVDQWNEGKQQEFKNRQTYKVG